MLGGIGRRFSQAKTRITHLSDGIDLLGFHLQWRQQRGGGKRYCMTFIADKAFTKIKQTIRTLVQRRSPRPLTDVITEVNAALRGWTSYFRHALAGRRFAFLRYFTWRRFVTWQREQHHWTKVKRWLRRAVRENGVTATNEKAIEDAGSHSSSARGSRPSRKS